MSTSTNSSISTCLKQPRLFEVGDVEVNKAYEPVIDLCSDMFEPIKTEFKVMGKNERCVDIEKAPDATALMDQ